MFRCLGDNILGHEIPIPSTFRSEKFEMEWSQLSANDAFALRHFFGSFLIRPVPLCADVSRWLITK